MARVNDDGTESNPFKLPGHLEPISSASPAICMYVVWERLHLKIYYL